MPESVTEDHDRGIIRVLSTGSVSAENIRASFRAIEDIRTRTGLHRVLVDVTGQETLPELLSMYDIARELPAGFRFAVVTGPSTKDKQDFTHRAAVLEGKAMWTFEDSESALAWLLSDSDAPETSGPAS